MLASAPSRMDVARRRHMRVHIVVITLLYFCQGLAQGCLQVIPMLILQRHPQLPEVWQGTLSLPLGAFVLKFLWAPPVDRLYIQWESSSSKHSSATARLVMRLPRGVRQRLSLCHRRVQWIAALQLVIMFVTVRCAQWPSVDGFLRSETALVTTPLLWSMLMRLVLIAFSSATQDIAVDAWAVEGLPESKASVAGTMQLVGVIGGILFVNSYVQLQSQFPLACSAANFFRFASIMLAVSVPLVVYLAFLERVASAGCRSSHTTSDTAVMSCAPEASSRSQPPSPCPATESGVVESIRRLLASPGTREVLILYLTRGWAVAAEALVISRLVSMGLLTASTWSRYRVYCTVVQLVLGPLTATRVIARLSAARVSWAVAGASAVLGAASSVVFVLAASPTARDWYGPYVVLPLLLVMSSLGTYMFVANMTLASVLAHRFPHDSGMVLTLLAAVGNLGHSLPPCLCLFLAGFVMSTVRAVSGFDTGYGTPRTVLTTSSIASAPPSRPLAPLWLVKMDVAVCSLFFCGVGGFLFSRFLTPAARSLERYEVLRRENVKT